MALNLEYYDKKADTESLRQIVCHFLNKNRNMKIKDNLSKGDPIKKIEEQLGKAKIINEDPSQKYTNNIQNYLCKLRKEKTFTDKKYLDNSS